MNKKKNFCNASHSKFTKILLVAAACIEMQKTKKMLELLLLLSPCQDFVLYFATSHPTISQSI